MPETIYIQACAGIMAQDIFGRNTLPETLLQQEGRMLQMTEPDYRQYFSIMQLRRMSRLTRAGITAAISSLAQAGVARPGAIITGTGKGSLSDTEKFMQSIREFEEGTLNPSPFIQSTYNSLNGLIGLHFDVDCYNTTFVHRGFSLEHAILDAMLLLREGQVKHALVGSFEEITQQHFTIKEKLGYWNGPIAGEGSFFFLLSGSPENAKAKLSGLRILFEPSAQDLFAAAHGLLDKAGLRTQDVDLLLLGNNGDQRYDGRYEEMASLFPPRTPVAGFKHISGEFDTAAGFALWMAAGIVSGNTPHPAVMRRGSLPGRCRHLLIYNHFYDRQHVLYLVSAPE